MRKLLLIFAIAFVLGTTAHGQSDTCDIDLLEIIVQMTTAQDEFDDGNTEQALTRIVEARDALNTILVNCGVEAETADTVMLQSGGDFNINIRSRPSTTAPAVGTVPPDEVFAASTQTSCSDGTWLFIAYKDMEGYVRGDTVTVLEGDVEGLPQQDCPVPETATSEPTEQPTSVISPVVSCVTGIVFGYRSNTGKCRLVKRRYA